LNVIDFLKGNFQRHAWTPADPDKSWGYQGHQTAAGVGVSPDSALSSAAAFACTRARAETLASLPAVVFEAQDGEQRRKARQNPMWALLHDQPNPELDSMTWYSLNAKRLINRGNALNLIEFNGRGLPIALWPVHNSRWEARRGSVTLTSTGNYRNGPLYYRIWPDETERYFDVPPNAVLNVVGFDTENGILARGVVTRARQEIGLDIAEQEYAGSMFKNGALPLGLIKHPWLDDEEQRKNLRADINSMHSGRENWNRVGFLWDKDASWLPLNFNPKDVQAIESRVFTAKALCRYYNVPPAIVQIFEDYKFSTVEAMLKQFVMLTVRPDAVCFERAIKSQLLGNIQDEELFLEFALEGLLRGDPKTQAEANAILRQWGILNADEWRQRDLNLNPLPGGVGEVYLAPLNYAPLESVVAGEGLRQTSRPPREPAEDEPEARWDKSYAAALLMATGHKPQAGAASALPSLDKLDFAWVVVRRQAAKMIGNEINAVRRRVKDGPSRFVPWLDEHYAKFQEAFAKAIEIGCEGLPGNASQRAADLSASHCAASREMLLTACACEAADFESAIEACISNWEERAQTLGAIDHECAAA
jgi:HK97 family phage portal protein